LSLPANWANLLLQSLNIYRRNLQVMIGIVAIVEGLTVILYAIGDRLFRPTGPVPYSFSTDLGTFVYYNGIVVFAAVAVIFEASAIAIVIADDLRSHRATIASAYTRALQHWNALLMTALINAYAFLLPSFIYFIPVMLQPRIGARMLFLANAAYFLLPVLAVLWTFAPQAAVYEHHTALSSLKRSWSLVGKSYLRVLLITTLVKVLFSAPGLGFGLLVVLQHWDLGLPLSTFLLTATISAVGNVLFLPVFYVVLSLLFFDVRQRNKVVIVSRRPMQRPAEIPR
jgi:hypothetical protein